MAEVHPPGVEHEINHEVHTPYAPMEGLQLRFLLGDRYVDPEVEIPALVRAEDIPPLDRRDNSLSRNTTTQSRIAETEKLVHEHILPQDLAGQKRVWIENTRRVLLLPQNRERLQKLTPLFHKLGMGPVSDQSIQHLYERVFANKALPKYESGGKKYLNTDEDFFIKAVLDRHTQLGRFNYNEFKNNIEEYRWFTKIFGADRQEAIVQKLDAYAQFKTNPFGVINPGMNLINGHPRAAIINLTDREKEIMKFQKEYGIKGKAASNNHGNHGNGDNHGETHNGNPPAPVQQQQEIQNHAADTAGNANTSPDTQTLPPVARGTDEAQLLAESTDDIEEIFNLLKITDPAERENADIIRSNLITSEAVRRGFPVLYENAGTDIKRPIAFTDSAQFIFLDPRYIDSSGNINNSLLPETTIQELGGRIIGIQLEGTLGRGGKRTIDFELGGKTRRIIQYAENTDQLPALKNTAGVVLTNETTSQSLDSALSNVIEGGFVTLMPTVSIPPELAGFEKIVHPPQSNNKNIVPVYQKMWMEPDLEKILKIDSELLTAINIRDGADGNEINEQTLARYQEQLKKLQEQYSKLSKEKKDQLQFYLGNQLLAGRDFTPRQKQLLPVQGKNYGLEDPKKGKDYLGKTNVMAIALFPQFNEPYIPHIKPEQLLLPDKYPGELGQEIRTLLEADLDDRIHDLPKYYAEAAAVFCDEIRQSLAKFGVQSPKADFPMPNGEKGYRFVDPRNGIEITAKDRPGIADAVFDTGVFRKVAQMQGLPLAFYQMPDRSALLLNNPQKINNEWKMKIYDPVKGEEDVVLHPQKDFEVYKNERKQYYSQYLNAESGIYTLPAKPAIPGSQAITPSTNIIAEDIDEKIFWEWILEPGTLPANHQVAANHFASQLMSNAQYDLTIPQELGIPDKIISSEDAGIRFQPKDSLPASTFVALARFTAKSNLADPLDKLRRGNARDIFMRQFHIPVLVHEEIMNGMPEQT
jgi:hypothetical protein